MKRFLITIHAVFVLVGIANTIVGPLLPLLAQRWHLGDRQSGLFFFAQFVGGFSGAIISTHLARRFSLHNITRAGLVLTGTGFLGLMTYSRLLATVSIAVAGIGIGLTNPTITAAVSEAVPARRASILNLLNFAWALGAITAPNLVAIALQHPAFSVQRMLICFSMAVTLSALLIPRVAVSSFAEQAPSSKLPAAALRMIFACGILIFVYVGIETGVAGWLPTFATRIHRFGVERTALLQGTFWTTLLIGRLSAPAFLRVTGERLLVTLSIGAASAGSIALLMVQRPWSLFVAVSVIGLGCAAIFPTAIAILSHRLSGQSGSKLGFMFASAGLGAAVLPFCIGSLSSATHDLRFGMWLLVFAEVVLMTANLAMSHFAARNPTEVSQASATSA